MTHKSRKLQFKIESNEYFMRLISLIDSLSEEERLRTLDFSNDPTKTEAHWNRDKSIKDILAHLFEWHKIHINWINSNKNGIHISFLPKPYTWDNYIEFNIEIRDKHQHISFDEAYQELLKTHDQVMEIFDSLSEKELFEKDVFFWAENRAIIGKFDGVTKSHYEWAIEKILAHKK